MERAGIRFCTIGTAGHVDHGKTALVKRLTGIDTDRLKEEKERGISIELGFAPLRLKSGTEAAIVDVPGHEKFVHHMLSGVGGIDLVLLVIAADEGIMPQTLEHLRIIEFLGIKRTIIALTKSDLVEKEWLDMVRKDVEKLLSSSPLVCVGVVPVSSVTGDGVENLLALLDDSLKVVEDKDASGLLRLPVDRVFIMEGFGLVVTGTMWRGTVRVGETVEILPSGKTARVRGVEVQKHKVDAGTAGQRTAIALHGLGKDDVERGEWVVEPGSLNPSLMLDAKIQVLAGLQRPVRTRERIRFHLGARESLGRIITLGRDELSPGETAFVQLRLEEPVAAERGDRFVLRSYSPVTTIAGGTVVDPNPAKHKARDKSAAEFLEKDESGTLEERVELALTSAPYVSASRKKLAQKAGGADDDIAKIVDERIKNGSLVVLPSGEFISTRWLEKGEQDIGAHLSEYEKKFPVRWGMGKSELRAKFPSGMGDDVFSLLIELLSAKGSLHARGERLRFGSGEMNLSPARKKLKDELENKVLAAGFSVPDSEELEKASKGGEAKELVQLLLLEGRLTKITSGLYFHTKTIEEARKLVADFITKKGSLTISDFKDLTGASRKYTVPLLEYLDKTGLTTRDGDKRVLRKSGT